MLIFIPIRGPTPRGSRASIRGRKGNIGDKHLASRREVVSSDALEQAEFDGKIEFMENIGRYNARERLSPTQRPRGQQIRLDQVDLGQLRASLSQHVHGKVYSPHTATRVQKPRGQITGANSQIEHPHLRFEVRQTDNFIQNARISGKRERIWRCIRARRIILCPIIEQLFAIDELPP